MKDQIDEALAATAIDRTLTRYWSMDRAFAHCPRLGTKSQLPTAWTLLSPRTISQIHIKMLTRFLFFADSSQLNLPCCTKDVLGWSISKANQRRRHRHRLSFTSRRWLFLPVILKKVYVQSGSVAKKYVEWERSLSRISLIEIRSSTFFPSLSDSSTWDKMHWFFAFPEGREELDHVGERRAVSFTWQDPGSRFALSDSHS
jgi:hypothetical protein